MLTSRTTTALPLIAIAIFIALFAGCRKDFLTEKPNTDPTDRTITLEEIMMRFNTDGNNDRSGERLPLYVRPLWDESYIVTNTGFPIIMTPVDTPCSCPDTRYGGNLAFYKDPSGNIQSAFVIWETDSLSTYSSNRAPLDSSSQFSGMMALVNQQDTIEKVVQVLNGRIMAAKKGKVAFADIPNKFIQGGPIAHDRDPWSWWKSLWGGVKCYNFGNNGINWNWWGNFWNGVADLFGGQTWDGEAGEHISYPPGSFFFGGFEVGWGLPEGYTEPGGSGLFDQQFSNQISTCTAINEYIQSIGEIPQGYSSIDLSFCQLINEVGLNGTEGKCLFSQYGTSNIEDLLSYWNASSKDLETAEKVKAYILGQCNGSFTPRLADLLKENFCLSQHPIDLMENIKNQCGLSSFDSGEWFDAFNSGLSECTKSIIIDDWFDLTNAEKDNLLNNPALYDQVVNFVKSKGCSEESKKAAESLVALQNQGKFPSFEAEDFIDPVLFANFVVNCALVRKEHPGWDDWQVYLEATWGTISGVVHTVFDICGLIPVAGELCDFANGVIFLIEGDGMNASFSFAATIPVAGWASTGAKYVNLGVKIAGTETVHLLKITNAGGGLLTFGAKSDLRTVMNITDAANDAHHVIPWSLQNKPIVQSAANATDVPYHMNHLKNGKEVKRFRFDQPDGIHANHPQYNAKVEAKMDQLWQDLIDDFGGEANIPPDEASQRLRDLQNFIRSKIDENPTTKINDLDF